MKINKTSFVQWAMLLIALLLVIILANQNYKLKTNKTDYDKNKFSLIQKSELNLIRLLSNKIIPVDIENSKFYFLNPDQTKNCNNHLLVVFNLTVCGQCLWDEIDILNSLRNEIESDSICILAVIGVANESEKREVLSLYNSKKLPYPYTFVEDKFLNEMLGTSNEEYLDTPVYFIVDNSFLIKEIFKPIAYNSANFEAWLTKTIN